MPIKIWENGAVLIYKKAKYIVPLAIAAVGYTVGRITRKKTTGEKK